MDNQEKGIRKITEKFINDLCKEYNVNKEWLLTGTGEKYIDMIEGLNIDDEEIKNFLKKFMQLDMKTKVAIMNAFVFIRLILIKNILILILECLLVIDINQVPF